MKKLLTLLSIVVFIFSACKDENPVEITNNNIDYSNDIQKILTNAWNDFAKGKENLPGGMAMQILSSEGDYFASTGELENATNGIHFRAASTTKTFTAAAILLLYQQGKLSLNHFLTDMIPGTNTPYIPDTENFDIPFKDRITIKMLIQHRAGIFDIINQDIPDSVNTNYKNKRYCDWRLSNEGAEYTFTCEELTSIVAKHKLFQFEPGERFQYSNTGFNLAGFIIERISGKRFDEFITENFLMPNNMLNTSFPYLGTDVNLPEPSAKGYSYFQGRFEAHLSENVSMSIAEGNVVTTPANLAHWIKQLLTSNAGIERKYIDFIMKDCQPTYDGHQYYGSGMVFTPGIGYGHNGSLGGCFTVLRYDPELDFAVAMFINVWDFETFMIDMYEETYIMYGVITDIKELMYNQ